MALASRLVSERAATNLWKLPFNLHRTFNFSTSPASASADATQNPASEESTKPKRKKKKNLFEVAQFLPNWGLGYHMAKTHWTNVSYEITKINLYKDGSHGKAWGLAYKDGLPASAPKKISGVHKRCWRYLKNPKILAAKAEAEPELKPEPQAA